MRDITEDYKKEVKLRKSLQKVEKEIEKQIKYLNCVKKESWICPNCKHRFVKPKYLDGSNSHNYWRVPCDEAIIKKPADKKSYSEWTHSGYDFYEAETMDLFLKCPHCGYEEFQYNQRMEDGVLVDSKDSW